MALAQEFVLADSALHHLTGFDCGRDGMNTYLANHAVKNARLGLSRTWVLTVQPDARRDTGKLSVAAYYTLAASSILRQILPASAKSLPNYPVPVTLIARLAISTSFQRQGLGSKTLVAACRKARELSDLGLQAYGVILDVLDDDAMLFYQHFGFFHVLTETPRRLFIPMSVLRQL